MRAKDRKREIPKRDEGGHKRLHARKLMGPNLKVYA